MRLINNLYIFKSNAKLGLNGYNNANENLIKNYKSIKELKVNLKNDKLFKAKVV